MTEETSEPARVYARFRKVFGGSAMRTGDARRRAKRDRESSTPFGSGRDPLELSAVIESFTERMGWSSPLARSELLASWAEIAGAETAEHSSPVGVENGVLTVACDSTAWATQLRMLRTQITTEIARRYPQAAIDSVRFEGPGVPSWKRGRRAVPGRGPRDTYG